MAGRRGSQEHNVVKRQSVVVGGGGGQQRRRSPQPQAQPDAEQAAGGSATASGSKGKGQQRKADARGRAAKKKSSGSRERRGSVARPRPTVRTGSSTSDNAPRRGAAKQPQPQRNAASVHDEADDADIIRWHFEPPAKFQPKYVVAKKGDEVRHVGTGRMEEFTYEIPKVELVENGLRGYINPSYVVSRKALRNAADPLLSHRWFVGALGPIDASMLLNRTNEGPFPPGGAMLVCAPPEYERTSAWREYLAVIRLHSGSEAAYTKRFNDKEAVDQALKYDRFPGGNAAPPFAIYVRVRRDRYGMYYYSPGNECMPTLDDCIAELHGAGAALFCCDVDGQPPRPHCCEANKAGKQVDTPPPPAIPQRFADWLAHGGDPSEPYANTASPMVVEPPKQAVLSLGKRLGTGSGAFAGTVTQCADYGVKGHAKLVAKSIVDKQAAFALTHANVMETIKRVGRDRAVRGAYYLAKYYEVTTMKSSVVIVREYFEHGSLDDVMQKHYDKMCLPSRGVMEIAYQVCCALQYLFDNELVHGHLTARNVMVHAMATNSISVRLADYYVLTPALRDIDHPAESDTAYWSNVRLEHNAPEVLAAAQYTRHSDMWSWAVLLCELYNGCKPAHRAYGTLLAKKEYKHWTPDRLRRCILEDERPSQPSAMPPDMYNLCLWCWLLEPKKRPQNYKIYCHMNDLLFNMVHGAAKAIMGIEIPDDVIIPKASTKKHGGKHAAQ